jgi:branched-chain amino acid transport system substrate-binding protein
MLKQAAEAGILPRTLMLISYDAPIRPEFWQNVGEQGKGIVFVTYYHPQQQLTDAGKWFQAEYQRRFNEPALYSSFASFGNLLELAQAINQSCSTDGPAIAQALETGRLNTRNQSGVSFPKADGIDWHRIKQPLLLIQYTEVNQDFGKAPILYPPASKTGELQR